MSEMTKFAIKQARKIIRMTYVFQAASGLVGGFCAWAAIDTYRAGGGAWNVFACALNVIASAVNAWAFNGQFEMRATWRRLLARWQAIETGLELEQMMENESDGAIGQQQERG